MKGIELLANTVRGELPGWYAKPEHCAHMFNYGGYMGDSEMPRCCVCNKTKAELSRLKLTKLSQEYGLYNITKDEQTTNFKQFKIIQMQRIKVRLWYFWLKLRNKL